MNMKTKVTIAVIGFVGICAVLAGWNLLNCPDGGCILLSSAVAAETDGQGNVLLEQPQTEPEAQNQVTDRPNAFLADTAEQEMVRLGSFVEGSNYKFELVLTNTGAAIESAIFSEYDQREQPEPLEILSPVMVNGRVVRSLENRMIVFPDYGLQMRLNGLNWQVGAVEKWQGQQSAEFEAVIRTDDGSDFARLIKRYTVSPESYLVSVVLSVENMTDQRQNMRFELTGATGIEQEDIRFDMRKVIAAYRMPDGTIQTFRAESKDLDGPRTPMVIENADDFLWAATVNKYFGAALVPETGANWVGVPFAFSFDNDNLGFVLPIIPQGFEAGAVQDFEFSFYIGPKDKAMFDRDPFYQALGFEQMIDFRSCFCCPASILNPLAFGILALMRGMYSIIPNYGIVIIILVLFIRLALHPITKKSQVSMHKFSKMAPRVEEIKKKYANNKAEMQKHITLLYKEQGAAPILGFLPMLIQMPIWISLYSAINASLELRGAAFLPFWITDLAAPDALISFPAITVPLLGWQITSLNILPLLMGVAMYLQQKLMPRPAAVGSNPQVAQQQKMMMIMMPLMFPIFLYNGPSGLNLYIMSSVFAGVIEQKVIRKHLEEQEAEQEKGKVAVTTKTGGKFKKKKPKPPFRTH